MGDKVKATQMVEISIPADTAYTMDYRTSQTRRRYYLHTEYAVELYNELKNALGF